MPVERSEQVIAVEIGSTGNGRSPIFNGRRQPSSGGTSRMMREYQVRNYVRDFGVKIPGSTRPPRIHGELLKLGIDIGQTSVAKVYRQATRPTVPRLGDVPPQPRRRDRCDGSVRRADNLVSPALWIADHGARPATYSMVWCHSASNRRMDRKSDHGSLRLGTGSPLSHS